MLQDLTIRQISIRLASGNPPPGGGSAAALNAMLGVATMQMATQGIDEKAHSQLPILCNQLGSHAEHDAKALEQLLAEYRMGVLSQAAIWQAAQVPLETARCCLAALEVGQALAGRVATHTVGDFLIGVVAVRGGLQGSLLAAAMNIPLLEDHKMAQEGSQEIKRLEMNSSRIVADIKGHFPSFEHGSLIL